MRACAAYNLGVIGDVGAVSALLGLLMSFDRRAAVLALAKIGSAESLAGLQHAVNDRDAVVRRFAEEAVG